MKNFVKTKWFTYATYILLVFATLLVGYVMLQNNNTLNKVITSFFEVAENRSFDYRQSLRVIHKQPIPNKDIVILAIDDASLEMLWEKYGEWPVPRNVYADLINYLEKDKPQALIFDLMFIKSMRASLNADNALIEAINKYNNIYTGMNFDNQPSDVRLPIDLPERISLKVENKSNINIQERRSFTNCRAILPELLNGKVGVGITNVFRGSDGIIRKIAPIMGYKNQYYPYLSFIASSDYVVGHKIKELTIDKNSNLHVGDTIIPLTEDGEAILNWYGESQTHTIIPLYKIIKEIENKNVKKSINFKDKIIFIGTTALALHDTKSVPIQDEVYPGVEIHATFFNNMLDNNFIKQTSNLTNTVILIAVVGIVGFIVMLSNSTIFAVLSTTLFGIAYLFISYYLMELYNLWIPIVIPVISIVIAFALSYLAK